MFTEAVVRSVVPLQLAIVCIASERPVQACAPTVRRSAGVRCAGLAHQADRRWGLTIPAEGVAALAIMEPVPEDMKVSTLVPKDPRVLRLIDPGGRGPDALDGLKWPLRGCATGT